MNNLLSLDALDAALKRKGWTLKDLAEEYDKKYPDKNPDKADKTIYPTLLKWNRGEGNPTLNRLIRISDLLEVDIDFLLGRITEFTHPAQYIHDITGLSHEATEALLKLNGNDMDSLNALLEDNKFRQVLSYIAKYRKSLSDQSAALKEFNETVIQSLISDLSSGQYDQLHGAERTIADLRLQNADLSPEALEYQIDSCFQEVIHDIRDSGQKD